MKGVESPLSPSHNDTFTHMSFRARRNTKGIAFERGIPRIEHIKSLSRKRDSSSQMYKYHIAHLLTRNDIEVRNMK